MHRRQKKKPATVQLNFVEATGGRSKFRIRKVQHPAVNIRADLDHGSPCHSHVQLRDPFLDTGGLSDTGSRCDPDTPFANRTLDVRSV